MQIFIQLIDELPKSLEYSLRFPYALRTTGNYYDKRPLSWQTDALFGDGYKIEEYESFKKPSYRVEGFLAIQNAIAKAFINIKDASKSIPDIRVQQFPTPSHIKNYLPEYLLPLFLMISINYTFMNTIRFIVMEKEKQLTETMRIMGLANWMHYLTWFIRTMILLLISFVVITILLTVTIIFHIS